VGSEMCIRDSPYTGSPNSLRKFLKGIPDKPVPKKVTQEYLVLVGLKSKADRTMIPVLKAVGLIDGSGIPTQYYGELRDTSKGPTILAGLIRKTYEDLYATYGDADAQDNEKLAGFFRVKSPQLGTSAIQFQIATFKALCDFADFKTQSRSDEGQKGPLTVAPKVQLSENMPGLHVTIQIHLPETKDPNVYDAIFEAMGRHLMKGR